MFIDVVAILTRMAAGLGASAVIFTGYFLLASSPLLGVGYMIAAVVGYGLVHSITAIAVDIRKMTLADPRPTAWEKERAAHQASLKK